MGDDRHCDHCGSRLPAMGGCTCEGARKARMAAEREDVGAEGAAHVAANHEVETFTGRYVDTGQPDPATICLEDIAHALAHTCRFGGHSRVFYSVAEHAIRVSDKLVKQGYGTSALAGLHHDDAEAYLGDIPRPLKPLLGDQYRVLTYKMDEAIAEALGGLWAFPDIHAEPVRWADNWMLRREAQALLPSRGDGWTFGECPWRVLGPNIAMVGIDADLAEERFIAQHHRLVELWT